MVYAEIREDHIEKAIDACETIRAWSCSHVPYEPDDCSPLKSLLAAKKATTPDQVLTHLKAFTPKYQPAIQYSLEVSALRKLGKKPEADAQAEACWKMFGDSDHPTT